MLRHTWHSIPFHSFLILISLRSFAFLAIEDLPVIIHVKMLHLELEDAKDWVYKGEGGANLILEYTGTSSLYIGKVLRVQKLILQTQNGETSSKKISVLSKAEQLIWHDLPDTVCSQSKQILAHAYTQHVIGPLLGFDYIDPGILVHVSDGFLKALEKNVTGKRPAWRVEASKLDPHISIALLLPDHSLLSKCPDVHCSTISIEIKPKCGFLPCSKFISKENYLKKEVPRFNMHQHLKLYNRQISCISRYSPLDLFSKSREKIQRAINALFETPQNNLRIFINGSVVVGKLGGFADEGLPIDDNENPLVQSLEENLGSVFVTKEKGRVSCLKELITEILYESKVLDRLLDLQQMDVYDIEGAIHAYFDTIGQPCHLCGQNVVTNDNVKHDHHSKLAVDNKALINSESYSEDVDEKYSYSHYLSSKSEPCCLHCIPIEASRKIVHDYLVAASAKDCSLILTFQPLHHYSANKILPDRTRVIQLRSTMQSFCYKAAYIDFDLKPLNKMVYYYQLDQNIVKNYTSTYENAENVVPSVKIPSPHVTVCGEN